MDLPRAHMHDDPDNEVEKRFWGRCPLLAATSQFHFVPGGKVQKALHRVKYQGDKRTGKALGKLLGSELLQSERFSGLRSVLHVPLHPDKFKERGYDQAHLIGEGVSEAMGIPHFPDLLRRKRHTDTQTRKGRYDRWRNVSGAFTLRKRPHSFHSPTLLVDDVLTTGSTLEACAHVLLEAKMGPVAIATVATA